jgi:hypothetical protein
MPGYRFYLLKPDGRIESASDHQFADDACALAHAKTILKRQPIEAWQGPRKVFVLSADGTVHD